MKKTIKQAIRANYHIDRPSGRHCEFYVITKKVGFKRFFGHSSNKYTVKHATKTMLRQKKFARHGLAPQVYGNLIVCGRTVGYFTEIVESWTDGLNVLTSRDEYLAWRDRITKITGIEFTDWFYKNFGRKNGQIIPIDFGN